MTRRGQQQVVPPAQRLVVFGARGAQCLDPVNIFDAGGNRVTGVAFGAGWNNSGVTVSYTCTEDGVGVDSAVSSLNASGTATGLCVDLVGNTASVGHTAQIDAVAPAVAFSGNAGSYGVLDTVAITCTAADALSGRCSAWRPAPCCVVADAPDPAAKNGWRHACTAAVQTRLGSGWLTTSQATTLTSLSHTI